MHYLTFFTPQRGFYRCEGYNEGPGVCSFCPNGIEGEDVIIPGFEFSCHESWTLAKIGRNGTDQCTYIQSVEKTCCPNEGNQSLTLNIDAALDAASVIAGDG